MECNIGREMVGNGHPRDSWTSLKRGMIWKDSTEPTSSSPPDNE